MARKCSVCGGAAHPRGLCVPVQRTCSECDEPHYARGFCRAHDRGLQKGPDTRFRAGNTPKNTKLTLEDAEKIRQLRAELGCTYQELGLMFGVSISTVAHVVRGRSRNVR